MPRGLGSRQSRISREIFVKFGLIHVQIKLNQGREKGIVYLLTGNSDSQ